MEKALFGAGCFWGVEDFFLQVPGVSEAVSGYAGGSTSNPTYKQVCAGDTNHAEAISHARVLNELFELDLAERMAELLPHPTLVDGDE